jgi:hypothetical protein
VPNNSVVFAFSVPLTTRWDRELVKSFLECVPYHLNGIVPIVEGRTIFVDGEPEKPLIGDPESIVSAVINDLAAGFRDLFATPLMQHHSTRAPAVIDPYDQLVANGCLSESSSGVFSYSGDFLKALRSLDSILFNFATSLGAAEEMYPSTVPTSLLQQSGYLNSFPHHALFVAPVRYKQESINVIRSLNMSEAESRENAGVHLGTPSLALAPTVCYHSFNARKDRDLSEPEIVTAKNLCHRFEGERVATLERLQTFSMREIVFFGDSSSTQLGLETCLEWFTGLLQKWDVCFEVSTANDPFFANTSDSKRLFQTLRSLKREVILPIPENRSLAVASFNNHGNALATSFGIRGNDNLSVNSSCVGFGLERLLYGLFYSFGDSLTAWPEEFGFK